MDLEYILVIAVIAGIAIVILISQNKEKDKRFSDLYNKSIFEKAKTDTKILELATKVYWKEPNRNFKELHDVLYQQQNNFGIHHRVDSRVLMEFFVAMKDSIKYKEDIFNIDPFNIDPFNLELHAKELGSTDSFIRLHYHNEFMEIIPREETERIQNRYNIKIDYMDQLRPLTDEYKKKIFTINRQ